MSMFPMANEYFILFILYMIIIRPFRPTQRITGSVHAYSNPIFKTKFFHTPKSLSSRLIFHEQVVVEHRHAFINTKFQTKFFHTPKPLSSGSIFHEQVEQTVNSVMEKYNNGTVDILTLPPCQRESLGVAKILRKRLRSLQRNGDCTRCWLQLAHCVCEKCPPLPHPALPSNVRRIFLLMHHKEIGLAVSDFSYVIIYFHRVSVCFVYTIYNTNVFIVNIIILTY